MALPDPGTPVVSRPPPTVGERIRGCLLWVIGGTLLIAVLGQAFISRLVLFPPMPPLHRPVAVVEHAIVVQPDEEPVSIRTQFRLAAGAEDLLEDAEHTVYFELDFEADTDAITAGVAWLDRAATIEPMRERSPATDLRWTLVCDGDLSSCDRIVEIRLGAADAAATSGVQIVWRLTAELRPPRGTELPEGAAIELAPLEGDAAPGADR